MIIIIQYDRQTNGTADRIVREIYPYNRTILKVQVRRDSPGKVPIDADTWHVATFSPSRRPASPSPRSSARTAGTLARPAAFRGPAPSDIAREVVPCEGPSARAARRETPRSSAKKEIAIALGRGSLART